MRFFLDREARKAYLFADSKVEEISLATIYAHLEGPLPNNVRLCGANPAQRIPVHIEFIDQSSRAGHVYTVTKPNVNKT